MNSYTEELAKISNKLLSSDVDIKKKYKILKAIKDLDISKTHLFESRLGKALKKCIKLSGKPGVLAAELFTKWKMLSVISSIEDTRSDNVININTKDKLLDDMKLQDESNNYTNVKDKYNGLNQNHLDDTIKMKQDILPLNNNHLRIADISKSNSGESIAQNYKGTYKFQENLYFSEIRESMREDYKNMQLKSRCDYFEESTENKKYFDLESLYVDKEIKISENIKNDNKIKSENYFSEDLLKKENILNNDYSLDNNRKFDLHSRFNDSPEKMSTSLKLDATKDTFSKFNTSLEIIKKEKSRSKKDVSKIKSQKRNNQFAFETFIKDSALTKPSKILEKKKLTSTSINNESDAKRMKSASSEVKSVSTIHINDLSHLPSLSPPISDEDMDEQSIYNRTDFFGIKPFNNNKEIQLDVDCTSKYSSERKIWVPTRKIGSNRNIPEPQIRVINGVPENIIAHYDYQKLMDFEGDDKTLMKQTESFWEKLFIKVHKSHQRKDNEKWREAFLRVQSETDLKLKELSARVKRNNDEKIMAINKAKFLNSVPVKTNRKIIYMNQ